ncbi:uncharacterized protein LOC102803869, partial [Saccoglossus kowalevskii]|uniref:Uncharacterized protein LOC102803869 n=1 Tax=Saccoglossus kowalevskii TaxID=10224 RepID=A0ABM0LW58_SACKO
FELYATAQNWDKITEWDTNLGALLEGEALFEYSTLSLEDASHYDKVKRAVLAAYHLTGEGFRQKFRNIRPIQNETGTKFVTRLDNYLQRWLKIEQVNDFKQLQDIILREQFVQCCTKDHATFLKERKPTSIKEMAKYADRYVEAHGGWHPGHFKGTSFKAKSHSHQKGVDKPKPPQSDKATPSKSYVNQNKGNYNCYICNKRGHFARDCRQKKTYAFLAEMMNKHEDNPISDKTKDDIGGFLMIKPDPHLDQAFRKGFLTLDCGHQLPVLSAACNSSYAQAMPVQEGKIGTSVIQVLRDSGCSGVVVKSKYVEKNQMTGEIKSCVLIDGTVKQFPVARIHIDTPFFVGFVSALCMDNPVYDLILGNIPGMREPMDPDANWEGSQRLEQVQKGKSECDSETETETETQTAAAVQTRSQKEWVKKPLQELKVSSQIGEVTPEMLRKKQQTDVSLAKLHQLAKAGEAKVSKNGSACRYITVKGILYREYQSPQIDFGNTFRQIVVPNDYRKYVLKVAHESILGGHLGAKKTSSKILTNFFWPGIQADVKIYCQSCDICQCTIPKGRVTKVPLGHIPIIEEPFRRVAVDLVGPIEPATDRGHRYILVLVDFATRYPDAEALKTIGTEVVAEALLEKFNGTLKAMLKKMCEERPKDWDRYIHPLLFAYREVPQESTGFAPFELIFGHIVRGPMMILEELWTGETQASETKSVYQYVLDLRERLERTCQLAREALAKSASRYRSYYNKKAKKVSSLNYKIDLGHTRKIFHANLLKKYHHRSEVTASLVEYRGDIYDVACVSVVEEECQEE